ncbi:MAG: hypothetical protein P1V20_03845 [Verrucomicrobiales bacterium]|nr:hypothetical protein [Verrucomicrobiales bacterium]
MTSREITQIALAMVAMLILSAGLTSCTTAGAYSGGGGAKTLPASRMKSAAVQRRNQEIASEPGGDYYIGRRWYTEGTRYWGYIRKPGQPWETSRLVVMDESVTHQPDRLQEVPQDGGRGHGFDHNSEYKLWGSFTGRTVYDPNSNLELPLFLLRKYQIVNPNPGFLFYPGEPYQRRGLPPKHPPTL